MPDAPERLRDIATAFRAAKALISAVELGVFTALAEGPMARACLAERVGVAERGARDFFDALVALGLLARDDQGRYRNSLDADRYLDRGKPTYIGDEFEFFSARLYPHWHQLTEALRSGKPQRRAGAEGYFQSIYHDEAEGEVFAKGMTAGTVLAARALAAAFPWRDHRSLVDVGTAQGALPVEILRLHSHLTAIGFDLPQVQPRFERYVDEHGLADRLHFVAGDFLSGPIPSANVVVMGRVLHNWDLATKRMLLGKAHAALPAGGALIVYERLIDDERRNPSGLLGSLNMLLMTDGGFDFTGADCMAWMRDAGFREVRCEPLVYGVSMVLGMK